MSGKHYDNEVSAIELQIAEESKILNVISMLKPKFGIDGNQFYFLMGDDVQSGLAGFGDTAADAAYDFWKNWNNYTLKAKQQGGAE